MKTFLKKYWVQLLFLTAAGLLFFVLTPYVEKSYLNADVKAIKKRSMLTLIWTLVIILGIIFIVALKHLRNFKDFTQLTFSILFLGLALFFILNPIFSFGAFSLNRLFSKETIEKKYAVVSNDQIHLLRDLESGQVFLTGDIIDEDELYKVHRNDTITFSFKKGLFGYGFAPSYKGKSITSD